MTSSYTESLKIKNFCRSPISWSEFFFFVKIYYARYWERKIPSYGGHRTDECWRVSFRISVLSRKFQMAERNLITVVSRGLSASRRFAIEYIDCLEPDCRLFRSRGYVWVRSVENLVRSIGGVARECPIIMILLSSLPRLTAKWRNSENGLGINQSAAELPDSTSWSRVRSMSPGGEGSRVGINFGGWLSVTSSSGSILWPCNVHPALLPRCSHLSWISLSRRGTRYEMFREHIIMGRSR